MSLDEEKKLIIQEVLTLEDEWVIKAIKKLLDLDVYDQEDISPDHKLILEERMQEYKKNPDTGISLEQFIEELKAGGKL